MKTTLKVLGSLILLLLAYLLFYPTPLQPEAWTPAPDPGFVGEFETNDKLAAIEVYKTGQYHGPEDVAIDSLGRVYGGTLEGKILRFAADGSNMEVFADTKGRPLGLHFDHNQDLIVADANKGLLRLDKQGNIQTLTTEADGKPFRFVDDLEIAADSIIYFSDASDRYGIKDFKLDLLEHGPNGRLLSYNPKTKETKTLLTDLYFANGIAVSEDQSFVLVNETGKYRVRRYWITGPKKGQTDIFLDNLPGFPDGVSSGGDGIFWVAFTAPRNPLLDKTLPKPFVRKILARLPEFLKPKAQAYGLVLGYDQQGKLVHNLQNPKGTFQQIASAQQFGDKLYFGSLHEAGIGVIDWPQK